ncbi:MAG: molybdopterin-binding protein [Bacteroidales bacterium]|jgi:molybdenum cofactor synthesis domain-containing protein|nr:molybdopterin-binding protein [Bacteroidales bacterium]MDD4214390.1 molybdopterin-binding protein [Bacteroidales bacterium]
MKIKVESVNISEEKGTIKHPAKKVIITSTGIENDAHSGDWHRQISMLSSESITKFENQAGRKINFGEFAENLTVSGINLVDTAPLDRFEINDVILEVTQIGKKCHGDSCAIYREVGNCVMPKEGIFCRVLHGGVIHPEDTGVYKPKVFKVYVITLSDRASQGVYKDLSGPKISEMAEKFFSSKKRQSNIENTLIPDDAQLLEQLVAQAINKYDIIITTGGTGIGPKDFTPDIVKSLLEKEIPGIMDMIRLKYGQQKYNALVSRSIAGVVGKTLVFTLPGSVKAVEEYMNEITNMLEHLIYMLHSLDYH